MDWLHLGFLVAYLAFYPPLGLSIHVAFYLEQDLFCAIFQLLQAEGAKTSTDLSRCFWDNRSKKAKAGFQRIRLLIEVGFLERGNPRLLYLSEAAKQMLPTALGVEDKKPQ